VASNHEKHERHENNDFFVPFVFFVVRFFLAGLLLGTRFRVTQKIVTGFAAIVSVSLTVNSDTRTAVSGVLTPVSVILTGVCVALTAVRASIGKIRALFQISFFAWSVHGLLLVC
jgi:hypothetical protein